MLALKDIRNFQEINDRIGAESGDDVLCRFAQRLTQELPTSAVARIDGDEFAVLSSQPDARVTITDAVSRLSGREVRFGPELIRLDLTCGLALASVDTGFETLLRDADLALQAAKLQARGTQQRLSLAEYEPAMRERLMERQALIRDLDDAIANDGLQLHFQPLVDLHSGRVVGAEALLRWFHPVRGFVRPDHFIPVAEDSGQIVRIGDWVLRTAMAQARRWREATDSPPFVSINLSPRQLADPGLVDAASRYVCEAGLTTDQVMLEITETAVMADVNTAKRQLGTLRSRGFRLAVDDFGTGHSSLAYLRDLPVTELKVAREFVSDLPGADGGLCASIIQLAHNLGLGVVAEGIETTEQYESLQELGADIGQGYLMYRPMPADDLATLIGECPPALPAQRGELGRVGESAPESSRLSRTRDAR